MPLVAGILAAVAVAIVVQEYIAAAIIGLVAGLGLSVVRTQIAVIRSALALSHNSRAEHES